MQQQTDYEEFFSHGVWGGGCVAEGDEVIEKMRTLHNEELHYLYPSPNIVR
jgi:hypothetical protein